MTKKELPAVTGEENNGKLILGNKPYSFEWAVDGAKKSLAEHKRSGLELGLFILAIKQNEKHGQYEQALKEIGLEHSTAWRYASRAEFFLTHQEKFKSCNLQDLTGTKQDALRKLPDVVLGELIDEDGNIGGLTSAQIKKLTTKEFVGVLAEAQGAIHESQRINSDLEVALAREQTAKETLQMANNKLREQLRTKEIKTWPEYTRELRMESSALGDKALLCIDDMERLMAKLEEPELNPDDPERHAHYGSSVMAVWTNLRVVQARINRLVGIGVSSFKEHIDETPGGLAPTLMSNDEIVGLVSARELMVGEHKAEKLSREAQRMLQAKKRSSRKIIKK